MKQIYLVIAFLCFGFVKAQNPADVMHEFYNSGLPSNYYYYKNNLKNQSNPISVIQPDGKIIVNSGNGIERIDDNVRDLSFNTGSGFQSLPYSGYGNTNISIGVIVIQPDGKIIVGGSNFTHYNGIQVNSLIRLNSDGSLDKSFDVNIVRGVVLQPDGKIIVNGSSNLINLSLFRLNSNGTLDTTFNYYNTYESIIEVILLTSGKILVVDGQSVLRINSDGSFDSSFNLGGSGFGSNNFVRAVVVQFDGKILIGGRLSIYNNTAIDNLIRINVDGSLDTSFSINVNIYDVESLGLDLSGKILVASSNMIFTTNNSRLATIVRLNSDGNIDNGFNLVSTQIGYCSQSPMPVIKFTIQQDGKIIINREGSSCSGSSFLFNGISRLNNDGSIDFTFNNGGLFNGKVNAIALQSDGKLLIGGDFTIFDGSVVNYIIRLNQDYSRDLSFNTGLGFNLYVSDIVLQPDGKILVGGNFLKYNNIDANKLIRLNEDGTVDTTFNTSLSTVEGKIHTLCLQDDGKILVGGQFSKYYDSFGGTSIGDGIVRLNSDSRIDNSFTVGTYGFTGVVNDIVISSDGSKIYVGGVFSRYSCCGFYPTNSSNFITLNSDASIYRTMSGITTPINCLALESNGEILIGSDFGLSRLGISNNAFSYTTPVQGKVNTIVVQADNKIVIGGNFTKVNGIQLNNRIARLKSNGILDQDFDCNNSFDGIVQKIIINNSGNIFVGGDFTSYKDVISKNMIILEGDKFYHVKGNNKLDINVDGCDINDINFPFLKFQSSMGQYYIPNSSGNYNISLTAGNYTLTPVIENQAYYNISPPSITVGFPTQGNVVVQDFCITPNGVHPDLEISLLPITVARPGFDAKYKLVFKNKGNQLQSGSVSLVFNDNVLDLVSSIPAQTSLSGNTLTWNYTNLYPMESREVSLIFNANSPVETPPLNGNDILSFTSTIVSPFTDEMPHDNTFTLNQTVVNSYDPNDKTCLEGKTVSEESIDNYVHYVIRFENSGTYAAQNITVTDYIDVSKFDINTLVPIKGSHLFTTKISNGNKVDFLFENINLPFDDANNDGYVAFKIKTKPTLVVGDTFSNTASIYFDYNSAITTNEFVTTIESTLSNEDFVFEKYFSVYPNPANDILNINKKEGINLESISVYNTLGQQVIAIANAQNIKQIDISKLKIGTYFILVNSDQGYSNIQFIKK